MKSRNHIIRKRVGIVWIAAVLLLSMMPILTAVQADDTAKTPAPGNLVKGAAAELTDVSGTLKLSVDTATGNMQVSDRLTGYTWHSNPPDAADDEIAYDGNKSRLQSQVLIQYKGEAFNLQDVGFMDGVLTGKNQLAVYQKPDSLTVVYTFGELGFEIPVQYTLSDRELSVSVSGDGIRETKQNVLISLTLLPFFGAGSMKETGYLLLPDGSGTFIEFNNGKMNEGKLEISTLYGNRAKPAKERPVETCPVLIPGFGISRYAEKNKEISMFAYAENGSFDGTISANVAGRETGYNYAYYTFRYREYDIDTLLDRTYAAKEKLIYDKKNTGAETYAMRYSFQKPEKAGLSGMADACRTAVFGTIAPTVKAGEAPLFLNVYTGVQVRNQFLGIPYKDLRPLTTFKQAEEIAQELSQNGVASQYMRLHGSDGDGASGGCIDTRFRADRALGGQNDFQALQDHQGLQVYPEVSLMSYTKSGMGVSTFWDSAVNILKDTIRQPFFTVASGMPDSERKPSLLLKVKKLPAAVDSLIASANKLDVQALSVTDIGRAPYGDYSRSSRFTIEQTAASMEQAAQNLQKRGGLMLDAPIARLMPYADILSNIPSASSGYNLTDGDVPFLQMVLSGQVGYGTEAVNQSGDYRHALLKTLETGSILTFTVMNEKYEQVSKTPFNFLYAATFEQQKQEIIKLYTEYRQVLSAVYGHRIIGYQVITKDLRAVTYDNHVSIVVNYGNTEESWKGLTVAPGSYGMITE